MKTRPLDARTKAMLAAMRRATKRARATVLVTGTKLWLCATHKIVSKSP